MSLLEDATRREPHGQSRSRQMQGVGIKLADEFIERMLAGGLNKLMTYLEVPFEKLLTNAYTAIEHALATIFGHALTSGRRRRHRAWPAALRRQPRAR